MSDTDWLSMMTGASVLLGLIVGAIVFGVASDGARSRGQRIAAVLVGLALLALPPLLVGLS